MAAIYAFMITITIIKYSLTQWNYLWRWVGHQALCQFCEKGKYSRWHTGNCLFFTTPETG